jgi:hypothetical protein
MFHTSRFVLLILEVNIFDLFFFDDFRSNEPNLLQGTGVGTLAGVAKLVVVVVVIVVVVVVVVVVVAGLRPTGSGRIQSGTQVHSPFYVEL